jgi:hypothetical protein
LCTLDAGNAVSDGMFRRKCHFCRRKRRICRRNGAESDERERAMYVYG